MPRGAKTPLPGHTLAACHDCRRKACWARKKSHARQGNRERVRKNWKATAEAIGKKETAEQAFGILRAGGTATIIGMIPQGTKIELDGSAFLQERRIQGSSMGSNHFRVDMPRYIEFYLQGRLKLDELVSRRLRLEDVNEAFQYMKEGSVARSVMVFD